MSIEVNVHEAKTHLSRLLNQALAGEEVIIMRSGRPLVRLLPVATAPTPALWERQGHGNDRRGF